MLVETLIVVKSHIMIVIHEWHILQLCSIFTWKLQTVFIIATYVVHIHEFPKARS